MGHFFTVILFFITILTSTAIGQNHAPIPILPDSIRWVSPPNVSGLQAAWILGSEQKSGTYILRVKLTAGTKIPPHTHPDERNTTVLKGTIYVGFGETFDEVKVVAIPEGAVYVAPANIPHFVWAKDGDAIYQEAGVGLTGTTFIKH
jgi:quercetin dioxygenase-like cupin family protein